jgi:hypothetical protein
MKYITFLLLTGCYISPDPRSETFERDATALNLTMAAGGYVAGFPEVAKMTYHLQFGEGKPLEEKGDFLLESSKVRGALSKLKRVGASTRVVWTHNQMWEDSPRVAFAANPMVFTRVHDDPASGCPSYVGKIWVSYPESAKTTLIPGVLEVQEGSFKELERRGKMKPYSAIYSLSTCDLESGGQDVPWVDDLLELMWSAK